MVNAFPLWIALSLILYFLASCATGSRPPRRRYCDHIWPVWPGQPDVDQVKCRFNGKRPFKDIGACADADKSRQPAIPLSAVRLR
jgi:hypothetical protein